MPNVADAPPARLFTTWGTVLYVDTVSGELRHGPIDGSPANAVFTAVSGSAAPARGGWLAHDRGKVSEPIICLPERSLAVSGLAEIDEGAEPTLLELVSAERGLIALKAGGLFLCAEPGGRITLSRSVCSLWECFLASEDWCTDPGTIGIAPESTGSAAVIDRRNIAQCRIDPLLRTKTNAGSRLSKVLFYGYIHRSHGRLYYDLCERLSRRGYIADILDWQADHSGDIAQLISYYDLFITSLDGIDILANVYKVPYDKIIALSHAEYDLQKFIDRHGLEPFARFGAYGVVSYSLLFSSLNLGVARIPAIVPVGIDFATFYTAVPARLARVGYASTIEVISKYGIEVKREALARECAEEAGLEYQRSASPESYVRFLDMPEFYRAIDAVLIPSLQEGAGLPAMEAAAAGRLVISTPVGHFPLKAYQGGGIIAPIEREKFRKFTVETLRYYKDYPAAYVDKCHKIQEAARQFDWQYTIDDWIEFIESAK